MQIVNVYSTGRTVEFQKYDDKDNQLIISSFTNTQMDPNLDTVELTVYGESGEFLDYNPIITSFKVAQGNVIPTTGFYTKIELDPKTDVNNLGLTRGRVNAQYNFLTPLFNSSNIIKYWIREISPSGTELKLSSQNLSNDDIRTGFSEFQNYVSTKNYFVDFYLNFGSNQLVIANNALLLEEDGEVYLLVKLYDPLPDEFGAKDTLWICDKVADSVIYTIDTEIVEDPTADENTLRGPNNRIKVRELVGQTTPYYSYSSLFSSTVSSSLQQLLSYYQDKSIEINVDYSNFGNFIHFSSATERLNNFVYKLGLIEQYQAEVAETEDFTSMSPGTLTIVSQSNALAQQNIDNIINKFDTYEYYLYYASESFAWPKSTSTKPYQLYSVTSSEALSWLGDEFTVPNAFTSSILYSASLYDNRNADRLANAIPQYLLEDANNEPYVTFMDMIGQHFDNVWLYYKDLSNRYSSFNSPNLGLSKDIVADALRGFGFNLYTNTSVSDNLYYTLFGMNQDGSLLPPTGSELITNYVTSSIDTLGPKQLDAEIYKRLYHNLTYLLKTRGTQRGVKALIASYGIPEDILDVNEFGGNSRYTGSGIYEINDQKINYFTQSAELSTPVLSPYVTLQKYNTDNRLNTKDIEVGFSPSDQINTNFVSSSGFVNMDQLIGNPEHQHLSYYPNLETVREDYFATYNYPHSIWEYIRIIKYYNNSLFKTIKDWVPARANASTGIIVKSHILERNKYARTEPSMSFDNNLSESIDMVSIAGGVPGAVQGSTEYLENIYTQYGETQLLYKEDLAKFTGKFSGSSIQATNGQAFEQDDYPDRLLLKRIKSGFAYVWYTSGIMKFFFSGNNSAQNDASSTAAFAYTKTEFLEIGSSIYKDAEFSEVYGPTFPFLLAVYLGVNDALGNEYVITINPSGIITAVTKTKDATEFFIPFNNVNYGATYQNLLTANRSKRFFELDYNFNQNVATNFGLVTQSISNSIDNNFDTYNDPYAPYADIQDYNYYTRAFTDNRYFGSKTKSLVYNTYTPPVSGGYEGDSSYGLAAAIDRNSVKLGWVKNFQSSSLNFYDKTSITLKYLVDENQNLLELNQRNENLFEVQNTFKSGENVIVSLSDILKPSFQKTLDGTKKIFRGGFSYDPILYRENGEPLIFLYTLINSKLTFLGYKGLDENWFGYTNAGNSIFSSQGLKLRSNGVPQGQSGTAVLINDNQNVNTPIASQNTFGQSEWEDLVGSFTNLRVNWGTHVGFNDPTNINNIRTSSIFEADPERLDTNNNGTYWVDPKTSGISLPEIQHYDLAANSPYSKSRIYDINLTGLQVKFTDYDKFKGGYFTDEKDIRPDGFILKASRQTTYKIKMLASILHEASTYFSSFGGSIFGENGTKMAHHLWGMSYKIFFTVEKSTDDGNTWKVALHSNIGTVKQSSYRSFIDKTNQIIYYDKLQGGNKTLFNNQGSSLRLYNLFDISIDGEIDVNVNDLLRLKFYIIDLDNHLRYGDETQFIFGKFSGEQFTNYTDYKDQFVTPYLEVYDKDTLLPIFEEETKLTDPVLFTAKNNNLIFTTSGSELFVSESIFIPSSSTQNYYSPVIDQMSIKQLDLIRIGQFKNQKSTYYNVLTSSISYENGIVDGNSLVLYTDPQTPTKFVGAIFQTNKPWNIGGSIVNKNTIIIPELENPSAFEFFQALSNTQNREFTITSVTASVSQGNSPDIYDNLLENKKFKISGTGNNHVRKSNFILNGSFIGGGFPGIFIVKVIEVSLDSSPPIPNMNSSTSPGFPVKLGGSTATSWTGGINCKFETTIPLIPKKMIVTLNKNIDLSVIDKVSQNFAILRPKPDETSVIIDHKKLDGNVSQTILIPEDLATVVKDNVGDIFKAINTDLINTNDNQTNNP